MAFSLTSPAFLHEQTIPASYTCDGEDVSIPIHWADPPDGTRAFALVMEDPDAPSGTFTHWVMYDLPAATQELPEGIPKVEQPPNGARQGLNDFHRVGYAGPCPPPGPPHRYFVTLYALARPTGLGTLATKGQVLEAIRGQVLAQAQIMGRYQRAAQPARPQPRRA